MSTLSVFDVVGGHSVLGGSAGGSFGPRSRFESESWKRVTRRSLLGFSLLFLVACGDDDDDPAPAAAPKVYPAREEGEIAVTVVLNSAEDITGLDVGDFQITAATGTDDAAPVTDAVFALYVYETTTTTDSDGNEVTNTDTVEVTNATTLMNGATLLIRVTSPSEAFVDSADGAVDFTISLKDDAEVQIGTATEAADLTTGDGLALANALTVAKSNYDTDAPGGEMGITGSGMSVTVTFDENLLRSSVQADDFTIVDSEGMAVSVTDAMASGARVILTLEEDWADTHVISVGAMQVQDATGVYNGEITFVDSDTTPPASFTVSTSTDRMTITLDFNEAVALPSGDTALDIADFTVMEGTDAVTVSSATVTNGMLCWF